MEKLEREHLKRKQKVYEKLGALKFQKIVFGVEHLKFKTIKLVCPNFIKYYDKYCDHLKKKALNKANSKEEADKIVKDTTFSKMAMRKEMNREKNRNYHIDSKKPTEIYKYLKWNRKMHENGLIANATIIPICILGILLNVPVALPLLVLELVSAGINFECINIQNYNICRYKIIEDKLIKQQERKTEETIKEYDKASEVIHKSIEKKGDIPSMSDIITNLQTKEQLEQMKRLIKQELGERYQEKQKINLRGNK